MTSLEKLGALPETILNASPDPIFVKDRKCRMVFANPAKLAALGKASTDVVGKLPKSYVQGAGIAAGVMACDRRVMKSGKSEVAEEVWQTGGGERTYLVTRTPLHNEKGRVIGLLSLGRDVTRHKQLERQILEISASERRRFSAELHDSLGQSLAGIALKAKLLEQILAEKSLPEAAGAANEIVQLANDTVRQTRRLAHSLDPVHLSSTGIVSALENLVSQTQDLFRVRCSFSPTHKTFPLSAEAGLAFYRIAQEAIRNAIAHGRASAIDLKLSLANDQATLSVRDNGTGFILDAEVADGIGLHMMQYRAGSIGGRVWLESEPEKGTCLYCAAPVETRPAP